MTNVAQTTRRRNEGGRFSTKTGSEWYAAIEAAHIARVEAMAAQAETARLAQVVGDAVTALPEAASRIAKAATLVQHGQVWPLTSGSFLVGSQRDPQAAHLVTRGPWHCDCPHMAHRQSLCSHALAAMLTVKIGPAYQATYELPQAA
jgi:hypothetical protein